RRLSVCRLCVAPRHLPSFPTRRSSDLLTTRGQLLAWTQRSVSATARGQVWSERRERGPGRAVPPGADPRHRGDGGGVPRGGHPPDRKSTRLNSSHVSISYAVFCLKKKR